MKRVCWRGGELLSITMSGNWSSWVPAVVNLKVNFGGTWTSTMAAETAVRTAARVLIVVNFILRL